MTNAGNTAELLELFDKSVEEQRQVENDWTFMVEGEVVLTKLRTKVVRGFLEHLLQHRAEVRVCVKLSESPGQS